jgi:small-conductance mechanosensitive channel
VAAPAALPGLACADAYGVLEVNIEPLLAVIGAAGFVIAFALQGTLRIWRAG